MYFQTGGIAEPGHEIPDIKSSGTDMNTKSTINDSLSYENVEINMQKNMQANINGIMKAIMSFHCQM